MTATPLPPGAVIRVSRGTFDPARLAEVHAMYVGTGDYLIPAIKQLPGLISYYAATHPDGSIIAVSVWESDAQASQMSHLKEMVVDARGEAEAAGVSFSPILNYPIDWAI